MSNPLSRRDADRILDAPGESDHPVGHAIQALRAPGSTSELRREDATLASFHDARLSPASRPMRGATTSARSAAVRAVAATGLVVALTSGGFALAASGHLPTLPDQASDTATEAVAQRNAPRPASPGRTATETTTETTTETRTETETAVESTTGAVPRSETAAASETGAGSDTTEAAPTVSDAATTAPTPHLRGLCTAYQASDKSAHGKALDSAAFTALATAAGGKDAVVAYCIALIGEPKATGKPTAQPTQAATGKPTEAATGKPTHAATGKPTTHATPPGQPAAVASPTDKGRPSEGGKPAGAGKPEKTGKP